MERLFEDTTPRLLLMSGQAFVDRLVARFGSGITGYNLEAVDPWIEVAPESLVEVACYLRDESDLRFNMLNCITCVDYFEPDPKKAAKVKWKSHLEVIYHLWSLPNKCSLVLKVILPRWKDEATRQLPEVPSLCSVWSAANWHEREVYDLSGVYFTGHPNLRRILCPEDWEGHPLRKDYEMPLEYHGIRCR
jgi:NADH-quinone oxidoreductase subunit C